MQKYVEFGATPDEIAKSFKEKGIDTDAERIKQAVYKTATRFDCGVDILPDKVTYVDNMNAFDGRDSIRAGIHKATGVDFSKSNSISGLSSGGTDKTLIPLYIDPTIVDLTRRVTPLVELIPRVTNYGITAAYNQITGRGVGGFKVENAPMNEADDTYARQSTAIKYAYSVGQVSGPMLAGSRQYLSNQYIDALNLEVRNKTVTLRYIEEDAIVNGDATTTRTAYGGGTTTSGAEFSGILKLISTNSNAPAAGAGTAVQITDIRKAIRLARTAGESTTLGQGDPNLIITDFTTADNIKARLQDYLRYVNMNYEVGWGLKTLEFEGLPIVPTKFMPVGSNVRKLAVLSTDTWQMRVLQDVTYEDLARTNDAYKFMIKVYESLICTAEQFNSQIVTIAD